METLRSILVAVDGSEPSIAALDHALALAADYGAHLDILHVVSSEEPLSAEARADVDSAMDVAIDRARAAHGSRVTHRTVQGDPVREIVEAARDRSDLIVIGTHGRSGRLHVMLGSVAAGVMRNAPCPVLTVRDPGPGYESFAERRHGRPTLAEQVSAH